MRDTFARTIYEAVQTDPNVFLLVADISPTESIAPFKEEFPDHYVNVGVAEQTMIGMCAGMALRGCSPFAYSIATFAIYRPFEQIRVDVCLQNLPVTIVGIGGGVAYAMAGGTHHALEDIALMSALPNMSIIAPCDPLETEAATWASVHHDGPLYLRLGKSGEPDMTSQAVEPFEFGKVRLLKDGPKVCVISYGPIMGMASTVASRIEDEGGQSVALVSAHTLKPLDVDGLVGILKRFETVVVIEEHTVSGGLGSRVKQIAWDNNVGCEIHAFGLKDEFVDGYGTQLDLWQAQGLSVENIVGRVLKH